MEETAVVVAGRSWFPRVTTLYSVLVQKELNYQK